jgi:ribonuclease E
MANKMLIDAAHPEETRVVVVRGNRVEEFDFESAARKQLRGNIYLAKVTRVEPSLQAAFVDYGGNRHGFLAFNEIHPDYYQIPVADRQALIDQDTAEAIAAEAAEDEALEDGREGSPDSEEDRETETAESEASATASPDATDDGDADEEAPGSDEGDVEEVDEDERGAVESVGADDALDEVAHRKMRHQRAYKIQEVIKRRQVILVQVVKEERGTKGAALTTYLSLAGRYCVLMPNTARGGGISRKITNPGDRRRLKDVAGSLEVPEGMGLIVRTAGANRTKAEIKRDFEYLLRLWENVRDLTLESSAPSLVYEEGSLIKRSIRDLYNKDVDSVSVEGDGAYKEAKEFMRMLMPSHAKNVQAYKEPQPIFMKNQVETQLDALFSAHCSLKSGGYLVINQTEALVAIDVNSGKSTKEHNIEDTALRTNLEAAEEVARQLRLRDLAGLIVIDFIDMEEKRNNRAVERRLKEKLKDDRARIQVGRISHFGLLEMSRQRMRSGMVEGSTLPCPHCQGRGIVRSVESTSLHILRSIEEYIQKGHQVNLLVRAPTEAVLYIINQKRDHLLSIEQRYGLSIFVETDETMVSGDFAIVSAGERVARVKAAAAVIQIDSAFTETSADDDDEELSDELEEGEGGQADDGQADGSKRKRRRRRRGRRRDREDTDSAYDSSEQIGNAEERDEDDGDSAGEDEIAAQEPALAEGDDKPRRRRGKRGGRRHRKPAGSEGAADAGALYEDTGTGEPETTAHPVSAPANEEPDEPDAAPQPAVSEAAVEPEDAVQDEPEVEAPAPAAEEPSTPETEPTKEPVAALAHNESSSPEKPRMGWWRRRQQASD